MENPNLQKRSAWNCRRKKSVTLQRCRLLMRKAGQELRNTGRLEAGRGLKPLSRGTHLEAVCLPGGCTALLECMSNLVANEVFAPEGRGADCSEVLKCGLHHLAGTAAHLVIVTNDIFSDGVTYDPETEQYRKILGEVNLEAAAMADYVYEVVCGIPICVKGEKRDFTDKNNR